MDIRMEITVIEVMIFPALAIYMDTNIIVVIGFYERNQKSKIRGKRNKMSFFLRGSSTS